MTADDAGAAPLLDAGDFGTWLRAMELALRGERDADVPCGDCTGCCTSSQFVHVAPDEIDALEHIPPELLFPAPGLPAGHRVMGYDERGHCPMLTDGACSIYAHRPRTCRTYDCRVFAAAGAPPDEDKPEIARRAARWRFTYESEDDEARHGAVRAAATYLSERDERLPDPPRPVTATGLAVLAIEVHGVFVGTEPRPEEVAAAIDRRRSV